MELTARRLDFAIEEGHIRPYYQAIVNKEKIPIAYEALARWTLKPELPAWNIFNIARENDSLFLLWTVLTETIAKDINTFKIPKVSVNISPEQLNRNTQYVMDFMGIFDPSRVILEITEHGTLSSEGINNISLLKKQGYVIAVDDFPMGGIERFIQIRPSILKLDQEFVNNQNEPIIHEYTRCIVNLCHKYEIKIIAEGIETIDMFELISQSEIDYDYFQGFGIHRPAHPLSIKFNNGQI